MNEFFVRIFLLELNQLDDMETIYHRTQEMIVISPKHEGFFSPLCVVYEDGEYIIRYMAKDRPTMRKVRRVLDFATTITAAWEQSTPMCVEKFQSLIEWNGIVLAARDDGNSGLHLATWRYDNDHQGVGNGHYTKDINSAIRDFIGRSGLVAKERLFDSVQLAVILSALTYRLENDGNLPSLEAERIKSILPALVEPDDYED